MPRQKKSPKVLWVCRHEFNCGGARCAEETKGALRVMCKTCGCKADCPDPVKYLREDKKE